MHAIARYAEASNKYMKNYNKNKDSSYLIKNLCGWAMSQKLPVDDFKWKKGSSKFNEKFIRNYDEDSDKDIFLK